MFLFLAHENVAGPLAPNKTSSSDFSNREDPSYWHQGGKQELRDIYTRRRQIISALPI